MHEAALVRRERRVIAARNEPTFRAVLLDRGRECFAEFAVVLHVELLMRELVEQRARDVQLAAAEHRAEHGVGKIAERRVRARAAARGVVALADELLLEALGIGTVEEAAVRNAARHRKAPAL